MAIAGYSLAEIFLCNPFIEVRSQTLGQTTKQQDQIKSHAACVKALMLADEY